VLRGPRHRARFCTVASSLPNKAGNSGPKATRAATGQGGEVDDEGLGVRHRPETKASQRTNRPSASVLPTSTVKPLRVSSTSPGPVGVAADGVFNDRQEQAQPGP